MPQLKPYGFKLGRRGFKPPKYIFLKIKIGIQCSLSRQRITQHWFIPIVNNWNISIGLFVDIGFNEIEKIGSYLL